MHCQDAPTQETALPIVEQHELSCKSCMKCLRKAKIMLGTLPDQVSQSYEVTGKTVRTVQMCSWAGDTANNSLQLEAAKVTLMHVNHPPPKVEVLEGNIPVIFRASSNRKGQKNRKIGIYAPQKIGKK